MILRTTMNQRFAIIFAVVAFGLLVVISSLGTDRATAGTLGSHLSASSTVVGIVTLQSVNSGSAFLAIGPNIELTFSSTGASSTNPVSSDGSFDIGDLEPGEYEVLAVAPGFVSRRIASIDLPEDVTDLQTVPLRAGLVNGDDVVDLLDISALASSFGESVSDRTDSQGRYVDMNGDGIVNIRDISATASNFGATSPQAWPALPVPEPQSVTLTATLDTTLIEDGSGAKSNGKGTGLFAGQTNTRGIRRALVQFDIAGSIPSGASITSVTLNMTVTKEAGGERDMLLHRVLADWGEGASVGSGGGAASQGGDATWIHSNFNSQLWASAGGDYSGTPSATIPINSTGTYTWGSTTEMAADVQFWLDNQAQDFGWIILGGEGQGRAAKRFASREFGTSNSRPQLTINYTP